MAYPSSPCFIVYFFFLVKENKKDKLDFWDDPEEFHERGLYPPNI